MSCGTADLSLSCHAWSALSFEKLTMRLRDLLNTWKGPA